MDPTKLGSALLFISYDSGNPASVTAEWADDKLRVLAEMRHPTCLITSTHSNVKSLEFLEVRKVPSLSHKDSLDEADLSTNLGSSTDKKWFSRIMSPTLGRVFDFLFESMAGARSFGRWSWALVALPHAIWFCIRNRDVVIFATGGPASAQLVGVLAGMITRTPVYCEYQDPLIGSEINISPRANALLLRLEKALIKHSTRTAFVTRQAQVSAKSRNPASASRISAIYPGSWDFKIPSDPDRRMRNKVRLQLMHLGSLYGNRNLDALFEALDALVLEGTIRTSDVEVVNQGGLYLDNGPSYLQREFFRQSDRVTREEALLAAAHTDVLLLVQHTDSRSLETIPYKFYDYLNLEIPIFGIVDNIELERLIRASGGYTAKPTSIDQISRVLLRFLSKEKEVPRGAGENSSPKFEIRKQFLKIFD